jgi:hypothetical protein
MLKRLSSYDFHATLTLWCHWGILECDTVWSIFSVSVTSFSQKLAKMCVNLLLRQSISSLQNLTCTVVSSVAVVSCCSVLFIGSGKHVIMYTKLVWECFRVITFVVKLMIFWDVALCNVIDRYLSARLHGITSQKATDLTFTALRTSDQVFINVLFLSYRWPCMPGHFS